MKTIVVLILLVGASLLRASDWRPSDELLHAIRHVESNGGKYLYGDNGRSLGDFQMTRAAWSDVNKWRKARKLKIYDYRASVFQSVISREYAANYLTILRTNLGTRLQRDPSASELYAAYNMGFSRFKACGFKISRVNSVTAKKCQEIESMLLQPIVASATPVQPGALRPAAN